LKKQGAQEYKQLAERGLRAFGAIEMYGHICFAFSDFRIAFLTSYGIWQVFYKLPAFLIQECNF
jgi:hypothetical protein